MSIMRNIVIYRHWQPEDIDAAFKLVSRFYRFSRDSYQKMINSPYVEPEGIWLALVDQKVVGHVCGSEDTIFTENKFQKFGAVTTVCVDMDMRRQGIATKLMQELHTYFNKKNYRGSILRTETKEAAQLYKNLGYQQVTRELQTQLSPFVNSSQIKWADMNLKDLNTVNQVHARWAKQHFVTWDGQNPIIHQFNMKQYRVLRRCGRIVGYAKWSKPSEYYPHGLIVDPVAPDEAPMEVIRSVQAVIPTVLAWKTFEGSRYEDPLLSLKCLLEQTQVVDMLLHFNQEIDLTAHDRTFVWS